MYDLADTYIKMGFSWLGRQNNHDRQISVQIRLWLRMYDTIVVEKIYVKIKLYVGYTEQSCFRKFGEDFALMVDVH